MNRRVFLTFCLMLVVSLHALPEQATATSRSDDVDRVALPRKAKPHLKGVELYSKYDAKKKTWRFGWLPGTNRLKTAVQVNESFKFVGLKALKRELAKFAENEQIYMVENNSPLKPNGIVLTLPSVKVLKELRAFCKSRKIKFVCASLSEG